MKVDLVLDAGTFVMEKVRKGQLIRWRQSLPFCFTPRSFLVHRVKSVSSPIGDAHIDKRPCIMFWCGYRCYWKCTAEALYAVPPDGELVCRTCEDLAMKAGLPSSAELIGQPVDLGNMRAVLNQRILA